MYVNKYNIFFLLINLIKKKPRHDGVWLNTAVLFLWFQIVINTYVN